MPRLLILQQLCTAFLSWFIESCRQFSFIVTNGVFIFRFKVVCLEIADFFSMVEDQIMHARNYSLFSCLLRLLPWFRTWWFIVVGALDFLDKVCWAFNAHIWFSGPFFVLRNFQVLLTCPILQSWLAENTLTFRTFSLGGYFRWNLVRSGSSVCFVSTDCKFWGGSL